MTIEQQKRLRMLVAEMRRQATAGGPYHQFWDTVFDIEDLIGGRPVETKRSADEWIALAEGALHLQPGEAPR